MHVIGGMDGALTPGYRGSLTNVTSTDHERLVWRDNEIVLQFGLLWADLLFQCGDGFVGVP